MQPTTLLIPALQDGKFVFLPISFSRPTDSMPTIFTAAPVPTSMEGLRNSMAAIISKDVAVPLKKPEIISKDVAVPVEEPAIISKEAEETEEVEENISTVHIFDIKVHLVRKKGEPYVLEEKISIPGKSYKTPEDLIYEINRSVKLRGVRNGNIYTISFDAKKKMLFAYNHHRQPRGSTLTITPIGDLGHGLGLVQEESMPMRNEAKLYFHFRPLKKVLAME